MIVDDWNEVCRENTDIENMHKQMGLQEEDTVTLTELVSDRLLSKINSDDVVMFNPMGMAVFDVAVAAYYYQLALDQKQVLYWKIS